MKYKLILLMLLIITKSSLYSQKDNLGSTTPLSDNSALYDSIVSEATNRGISLSHAQLEQAMIGSYTNSTIQCVILADSSDLSNVYAAYFDHGLYSFLKLIITDLGYGIKNYAFKSIDGHDLYYSFSLNSDKKIGDLDFGQDIVGQELRAAPDRDKTCPQQYPHNFFDCMNCALKECYGQWLCALLCSAGGVYTFLLCSAGWALGCLIH